MADISAVQMTATVSEAFESRTSKAGKTYVMGEVSFFPERANEPVAIRAFAFSEWPFKEGFPLEGDRVLVSGRLSPEREGGLGLVVESVQFLEASGSGNEEEEEEDVSF